MNTYQHLCTQYYELSKPDAPADALQFYMEYAKEANGPIFEPMCGTGRFLIPMLNDGLKIEGADPSTHMLEVCREKCRAKQLTPQLYPYYLHEMDPEKKYALIFIPSGSFGLITEPAQAKQCMQVLYNQLETGGKLVFEIETFHALPAVNQPQHHTTPGKNAGEAVSLDINFSFDDVSQVLSADCTYNLTHDKVVLQSESEMIQIRYYQDREVEPWLIDAGFKKFSALKAYQRSTPGINDELIVYECTK